MIALRSLLFFFFFEESGEISKPPASSSPPLLSALHRGKDRICLVLLSMNHGVNKQASRPLYAPPGLVLLLLLLDAYIRKAVPPCSDHISISILERFGDLFALHVVSNVAL